MVNTGQVNPYINALLINPDVGLAHDGEGVGVIVIVGVTVTVGVTLIVIVGVILGVVVVVGVIVIVGVVVGVTLGVVVFVGVTLGVDVVVGVIVGVTVGDDDGKGIHPASVAHDIVPLLPTGVTFPVVVIVVLSTIQILILPFDPKVLVTSLPVAQLVYFI